MAGKPLLIGDKRIVTRATQRVLHPFDGSPVGEACVGGEAEIELALAAATRAFARTKRQPAHERAAILQRAADLIRGNAPELAELVTAESGKPSTLSEVEVQRCALTFSLAAAECLVAAPLAVNMSASPAGQGADGIFHRVPLGLVLAITPFNFPLNLAAHKLAPALATGCTVLLKPSPRTPLTALRLTELLLEAGMPPGQVNCVVFDPALVPAVLADPRVKMLSFTGSAAVGWPLKGQAVKQRVTLELGGNAAAIVHRDADLAKAVPLIASSAYGFAGQTCISLQRVFVQREILAEFKDALLTHLRDKVRHGDPRDRGVIVGPVIDAAARDRILAWVDEALKAGAQLLTPLRVGREDTVLPPILLEGLPAGTRLACDEVFGPVLALEAYDGFDGALARVNESAFGLQACVFTRDLALARQAGRELEAGAVLVNTSTSFRLENMPYGGVKDSGFGREGVRFAMEDMTELRGWILAAD